MTTRLVDDAAREAIRTRLDVTMMVEAAAGTGKTTSLVNRMVALIRTGTCSVETVAAITFTVKAASHLRERFHDELQRAAMELKGEERSRADEALRHIARCFVGTTHAFCARLLRERPVEAGIDPEFEELEEAEAAQLTAEFYRSYVERQAAIGNEDLMALREAGVRARDLRDAFRTLTRYPDVSVASERRERPKLENAFAALNAFLDDLPPLPDESMREKPDAFETLMRTLLQHRAGTEFDSPSDVAEFLDVADHASKKPTQKNWATAPDARKAIRKVGEDYRALVLETIRPALTSWREYLHGLIVAFLLPGVRGLAEERRRNGTLTFEDLLLSARDLLRDHPNVRRYFQKRFTHLLVDEFQDTDPLQAEVMFYLTGARIEERRWKEVQPKPGSLFVVGDPKQSIYRFRRADITTYLDVRDRILASGGEVVQLSTNFRSFPSICEWVNRNFATMFESADVEAGRQAAHVDLVPHRMDSELCGIYRLDTDSSTSMDETIAAEAERVARWIRESVQGAATIEDEGKRRPLEWRDIMLVSWRRPRLSVYAQALERAGIPYHMTGGRSFSRSDELHMLRQALRCIIDPDDSVALAAFLRGPLCGVDDQALYEFVRAGGSFRLYARRPEQVDPRITNALDLLREAVDESHRLPPAAMLSRLFDRLGIFALAMTKAQRDTRAGNLLLALSHAREASRHGGSLADIALRLEELLADESEVEEMSIDPSRADAVQLMNLHQVKGLEAPVVFLVEPAKLWSHDPESHIDRSGDDSVGYFTFHRWKGKRKKLIAAPPGWETFSSTEDRFTGAETRRSLYVAATRARNVLVVGFGMNRRGVEEGAWAAYQMKPVTQLPAVGGLGSSESERVPLPSDAAAARVRIDADFEVARDATYSVLPITKLAKASHAELVKQEEGLGKGTSWGRVMHRLLEALLRDERIDVKLYASNLLKDEERDVAEVGDVLRVVEQVTASAIWARVKAADERLVEVPFAIEVATSELGIEGPPATLLHGQIDLVFREGSEWYVVDYKSDITRGRLEALVEYYAPQVRQYTKWWSRMTSAVTHGGLFFIDQGEVVWLNAAGGADV